MATGGGPTWTRRLLGWGYRAAGLFFGYSILHHEIYETDTAEPLLIALGLWLCGIPLATLLDGFRKIGSAAKTAQESIQGELPSDDKPSLGSAATNGGAPPTPTNKGEERCD